MMRRVILVGLIVLLCVVGGWWFWQRYSILNNFSPPPPPPIPDRGDDRGEVPGEYAEDRTPNPLLVVLRGTSKNPTDTMQG